MRPLILLLILSVASATSAGCFGKDDDDPPATTPTGTTPTPTGATPTGATPATPTPGDNATPPAKPAPRDLCAVSFSFEQNVQPGTPPAAPTHVTAADCGAVTAGYTTLTLNVTFSPEPAEAPLYAANGISVVVLDAAGTAVATCAGPGPGPAEPIPCSQPGTVTAGAYTLQFNGQGNVVATGTVQIG